MRVGRSAVVALLAAVAPFLAPLPATAQDAAERDSLLAAARAASARGEHEAAWRALRAAYDPAADEARVLALLAGAAASAGDLEPFRAFLDSLVRGPGGGPHALAHWSALTLDRGVPADSVLAVVDARLAARPPDPETVLGLVRVLRAHQLSAEAGDLLDRAAAGGADPARLAIARGDVLVDQGDAAGALEAWLAAALDPEAMSRMRALVASRPAGYTRDPLLERLRSAVRAGAEPAARSAAAILAEVGEERVPAPPGGGDTAGGASAGDPVAAARDTTELALALASGRAADARLAGLRAGDLWLARGVPDSAVAAYGRAVSRGAGPQIGQPALDALARIRLVRSMAGAPRAQVAAIGALAVQAAGAPGPAASALDALVPALGLADSAPAKPLLAALAAEWRGRAGDPAGASAALEAAAGGAGAETPALLLAAGRWALAAREDERARALLRAVVERHGDTPYALEARRLLAGAEAGG